MNYPLHPITIDQPGLKSFRGLGACSLAAHLGSCPIALGIHRRRALEAPAKITVSFVAGFLATGPQISYDRVFIT